MATPEAPKQLESQESIPSNLNPTFDETFRALDGYEWVDSWKLKYLRESTDWQYNVYKYVVATWGNKWWIKNQYESQIGPWVEWTQFTDVNWNELKQDWFNKWDTVYLRVPKNKETKNNSWKVEYIWKKKDKENRSRKYYSYTFVSWWNLGWVINKWNEQKWNRDYSDWEFCDENWNKLQQDWFEKWETIYIKEPNTDIIDPTPEMSMDEIMSLSDEKMRLLLRNLVDFENGNIIEHKDKKWYYMIIEGRKVYAYWDPHGPNDNNTPYFYVEAHESAHNIESVSIFKKDWDKFKWVYRDWNGICKWRLIGGSDIGPENYEAQMVFSSH